MTTTAAPQPPAAFNCTLSFHSALQISFWLFNCDFQQNVRLLNNGGSSQNTRERTPERRVGGV